MTSLKRFTAFGVLVLVLPAALFMASLFLQHLEPAPPAHAARQLVEWFSTHVVLGLYICLVALPLTAFFIGGLTVLLDWNSAQGIRRAVEGLCAAARGQIANLLIVGATAMAGGILVIVGMHMLSH